MALRDKSPQLSAWLDHIIKGGAILGAILSFLWFGFRGEIKQALGITPLETRVESVEESSRFLAVVSICNSGKYAPDEIKAIKTRYRRGVLDVDSLIADWYER